MKVLLSRKEYKRYSTKVGDGYFTLQKEALYISISLSHLNWYENVRQDVITMLNLMVSTVIKRLNASADEFSVYLVWVHRNQLSQQKSVESQQKSLDSEQKSLESEQKSVESQQNSEESQQNPVEFQQKSVVSQQNSDRTQYSVSRTQLSVSRSQQRDS